MDKIINFSPALVRKLAQLDDLVSVKLNHFAKVPTDNTSDYGYLDVSDNDGMLSYTPMKKALELPENDRWSKHRYEAKVGRIARAILLSQKIDVSDNDIEIFTNKFRGLKIGDERFKLVQGEDIRHWYDYHQYSGSGGSLWNSCMRSCGAFLNIYVENPNVSLLILTNGGNKLEGRALVWNNVALNGELVTYMDRIYSLNDSIQQKFRDYSNAKGWWHKELQSNEQFSIIKGNEVIKEPVMYIIPPKIDLNSISKPFMDTFKFLKHMKLNGKYEMVFTNCFEKSSYKEAWIRADGHMNKNDSYIDPIKKMQIIAKFLNIADNQLDESENPNTYYTIVDGIKTTYYLVDKNSCRYDFHRYVKNNFIKAIKEFNIADSFFEYMNKKDFLTKYSKEYDLFIKKSPNAYTFKKHNNLLKEIIKYLIPNGEMKEVFDNYLKTYGYKKTYDIFRSFEESNDFTRKNTKYHSWFQFDVENEQNIKYLYKFFNEYTSKWASYFASHNPNFMDKYLTLENILKLPKDVIQNYIDNGIISISIKKFADYLIAEHNIEEDAIMETIKAGVNIEAVIDKTIGVDTKHRLIMYNGVQEYIVDNQYLIKLAYNEVN